MKPKNKLQIKSLSSILKDVVWKLRNSKEVRKVRLGPFVGHVSNLLWEFKINLKRTSLHQSLTFVEQIQSTKIQLTQC